MLFVRNNKVYQRILNRAIIVLYHLQYKKRNSFWRPLITLSFTFSNDRKSKLKQDWNKKNLRNWLPAEINQFGYMTVFLSGFSFTDIDNSPDSRGRERTVFLSLSTTSTFSQTFRHLFATLHLRWSHWSHCLYLPSCYSMSFTTSLNYEMMEC